MSPFVVLPLFLLLFIIVSNMFVLPEKITLQNASTQRTTGLQRNERITRKLQAHTNGASSR